MGTGSPRASAREESVMKRIGPLYVITDSRLIPRDRLPEAVEKAIRGGADVVQLREKKAPREVVVELGRRLLAVCRRHGVPLIVNDLPEVAAEIGADGVHVGRDDPPVSEARRILGDKALIGASAYGDVDLARRLQEEGADYVAFGNFFRSPIKPEEQIVPLSILREARRVLSVPIVAIGGINLQNLDLLIEAGPPDAIAVISSVFGAPDIEAAARALKEKMLQALSSK